MKTNNELIAANQQNPEWEILEWDSNFFGFIVARVIPSKLNPKAIKSIINDLKQAKARLVYWAADSRDKISQKAAADFGGILVDQKVTYAAKLKKNPTKNLCLSADVKEYQQKIPNDDLYRLAIQSGYYSRFNVDPNINQKKFRGLYKLWILNSTKKFLADAVLVIKIKNKIAGMVTVSKKGGKANIGLIAVSPDFRGRGLGTNLVRAAQLWSISKGCQIAEVVTQKANIAACKLYEKCGYQIEKIENFYHFWLNKK